MLYSSHKHRSVQAFDVLNGFILNFAAFSCTYTVGLIFYLSQFFVIPKTLSMGLNQGVYGGRVKHMIFLLEK